ncbi:probable peroxisomal acyl-coenzyme A oxidase 1 isoform X2 [Drosophila novamexicana]|uniref:probable peroxisomal acyl-coenzyme A oxidase 1 isoform X2 n=2 Tax=Drosophila novamexicana TaxID=47314 RepID=UPI0011E5F5E1|nr:probable peroxisomal acyl-coenzyme A oxidase 1 isoform X2 [Drosophila novamexicana]
MSSKSVIPSTVNPDLQKERDAASFSSEEFAAWWAGGADKLKFKRSVKEYMYTDIDRAEYAQLYYKSHEDMCEFAVKSSINVAKKLRQLQSERNPGGNEYWPTLFEEPEMWGLHLAGNPFGVMYVMVVKALKAQCTPEQYEEFGKRVERFEVTAAYAQTELGHGTYLRGLETRADFDRDTDEFVLNTPTISSYKWWPGGLGHSSNYSLVMAQLYIDGELKGPHLFYVQVREEDTFEPRPGVHIGEIGKKMGFLGVNNGFLGMKNVRIPRSRMMMRHAQVLRDGSYVKSPVDALAYFAMVSTRCIISRKVAVLLTISATIATRYSAVRRQSPIDPKLPEPQIIDHVTQQLKVFPEIAASVAFHLASDHLWDLFNLTTKDIDQGKYERLPELHALSCSLKVISSSDSAEGIERLRLACGGHGYLASANLADLYASATAACTYEGENTVLLLQIGRFLMKSWRAAQSGAPLAPTASYLADVQRNPEFGAWTGSWENMVKAMQFAAANKTRIAFNSLSKRLANGESEEVASNHTGIELAQAAELHSRAFVLHSFLSEITGPKSKARSSALNRVLEQLLELYLVNITLKNMSNILRVVHLTDADLCQLQARLETALTELRPEAVSIVDGFDFCDGELSSTLGSFDGNAYERIFDAALKSPMNRKSVPKSFHEHLGPFMKSNI